MCGTCHRSSSDEWTPQKALRAAKFHTKLLLHCLERLDLPVTQLQELHLATRQPQRQRRASRLPRSGVGEGRWRSSPTGAIFLSLEARCPIWRQLLEATNCGHLEEDSSDAFSFSCQSCTEAALVDEFELHLCAALRHLSAASTSLTQPAAQEVTELSDAIPSCGSTAGASNACQCSEAAEIKGAMASATVACALNESAKVRLDSALNTCLGELVDVAWAFYLRTQLVNSLLQGDVLRTTAWAVQFLGVAEPFGLRRVQDLAALSLEFAVEHLGAASSRSACEPQAWNTLRGACAAYLCVPIIPRFQARLRKAVTRLVELGLCGKDEAGCQPSLQRTLDTLLRPEETSAAPACQFDASGAGLATFRSSDHLHVAFRKALVASASSHRDGRCQLDVHQAVTEGIEAVASFGAGGPMPSDRSLQLLEVTSSLLHAPAYLIPPPPPQLLPARLAPAPKALLRLPDQAPPEVQRPAPKALLRLPDVPKAPRVLASLPKPPPQIEHLTLAGDADVHYRVADTVATQKIDSVAFTDNVVATAIEEKSLKCTITDAIGTEENEGLALRSAHGEGDVSVSIDIATGSTSTVDTADAELTASVFIHVRSTAENVSETVHLPFEENMGEKVCPPIVENVDEEVCPPIEANVGEELCPSVEEVGEGTVEAFDAVTDATDENESIPESDAVTEGFDKFGSTASTTDTADWGRLNLDTADWKTASNTDTADRKLVKYWSPLDIVAEEESLKEHEGAGEERPVHEIMWSEAATKDHEDELEEPLKEPEEAFEERPVHETLWSEAATKDHEDELEEAFKELEAAFEDSLELRPQEKNCSAQAFAFAPASRTSRTQVFEAETPKDVAVYVAE